MDSPVATFRPARLQDAQTMAELSRELIEGGLDWRYTPPRMAALIGDSEHVALVACDASGILGFAVMQFGDEHAHLCLLCVRRPHQQRGIGAGLFEWLLGSARVAGIVSVKLELRADNTVALAFYRRLGFIETQIVPDYYGGSIAARQMVRRLRQDAISS